MAAFAWLRDFTRQLPYLWRHRPRCGEALAANGTEPLVLAVPLSIDEAAAGYLAGTLVTTHERFCLYG